MSDLDRLLSEYLAAHEAGGGPPDPRPFLDRASPDERSALARRIDEHLAAAPRRAWDPAAFEATLQTPLMREIATSARGASGLWPALLPRLRNRARVTRGDLVGELADRLGVGGRRDKVERYYHQMEQGLLPSEGVSDSVLEALGAVLGESREALRRAGQGPGSRAAGTPASPGAAFARTARVPADEGSEAAASPSSESEWDAVDRLFRGG